MHDVIDTVEKFTRRHVFVGGQLFNMRSQQLDHISHIVVDNECRIDLLLIFLLFRTGTLRAQPQGVFDK